MNMSFSRGFAASVTALFIVVGAVSVIPRISFAQAAASSSNPATNIDPALGATIRQQLQADPRSAQLTPSQLDAMVNALTKQAQKQGMTTHDITWRPSDAPSVNASATFVSDDCGGMPAFVCDTEKAFGVTGPNTWIIIGLGVFAGLLIIVILEMLVVHHRKENAA
jgi:hypothetical protein